MHSYLAYPPKSIKAHQLLPTFEEELGIIETTLSNKAPNNLED